MGFRFRKSVKIGPVRLTAGKKSASVSVGVKGARVSKSTTGRTTRTVSAPGTGMSWSSSSASKSKSRPKAASAPVTSKMRVAEGWEQFSDYVRLVDSLGVPDVVGESHYQPALKSMLDRGGRMVGVFFVCDPTNVHDKNAVAVVGGDQVLGYLGREDAKRWKPELARLRRDTCLAPAQLLGGEPGKPSIGVFPLDPEEYNASG